jgi:hypothetical protein
MELTDEQIKHTHKQIREWQRERTWKKIGDAIGFTIVGIVIIFIIGLVKWATGQLDYNIPADPELAQLYFEMVHPDRRKVEAEMKGEPIRKAMEVCNRIYGIWITVSDADLREVTDKVYRDYGSQKGSDWIQCVVNTRWRWISH